MDWWWESATASASIEGRLLTVRAKGREDLKAAEAAGYEVMDKGVMGDGYATIGVRKEARK